MSRVIDRPTRRVLGIDPGLTRCGFGVVDDAPSGFRVVEQGAIVSSPDEPLPDRLANLFARLTELIARWGPQAVAIERVFMKSNQRTAVPSIQASGIAMACASRGGSPVFEYSPAQVKQTVVGSGTATKEQVRFMVERLVKGGGEMTTPDAVDAVAVAIAHHNLMPRMLVEAVTR